MRETERQRRETEFQRWKAREEKQKETRLDRKRILERKKERGR